jgi:hypothetical protein
LNNYLIFNHHSFPFDTIEEAKVSVPDFIKIALKARTLGLSVILFDESVDHNWYRIELAVNYYWQDWFQQYKENSEYIDLIRVFRSITTRQPLFMEAEYSEGAELFEVGLKKTGESLSALCAASWFDAPLTSFPTRHPWDSSPIDIFIHTLNEAGEMDVNHGELNNFYSNTVLESLKQYYCEKQLSLIKSGRDLINQVDVLYPYINLCGKSVEQLNNWSYSYAILEQLKDTFTALNNFAENWRNKDIPDYSHLNLKNSGLNHQVSGESQTVSNNPSLRNQREFRLPSGRKEYFENHVKLSNGFRIHFFPDTQTKIIYIGYIGSHLRLK